MNHTRTKIAIASALLLAATGCKSYWIDSTVDNQTGEAIHELEVDYPSASFGTNTLPPSAAMHYRFQIRGSGSVKVEYTVAGGKVIHAQGTSLAERQQGQLVIQLLPGGKVQFFPRLEPAS